MSIAYSYLSNTSFTVTVDNGNKIKVFAQTPMSSKKSIEQYLSTFKRRKTKPEYMALGWPNSLEDMDGSAVVKVPEGFSGISNDSDQSEGDMEQVGTLILSDGRLHMLTSIRAIEDIRRERRYKKMQDGKMMAAGISDPEEYRRYLRDKDEEYAIKYTNGESSRPFYLCAGYEHGLSF